HNSGSGIVLGSVNNGLVERSVAHDNGDLCHANECGAGIWAYDSTGITIQSNLSYSNETGGRTDGDGFDLDQNTSTRSCNTTTHTATTVLAISSTAPRAPVIAGTRSASTSAKTTGGRTASAQSQAAAISTTTRSTTTPSTSLRRSSVSPRGLSSSPSEAASPSGTTSSTSRTASRWS